MIAVSTILPVYRCIGYTDLPARNAQFIYRFLRHISKATTIIHLKSFGRHYPVTCRAESNWTTVDWGSVNSPCPSLQFFWQRPTNVVNSDSGSVCVCCALVSSWCPKTTVDRQVMSSWLEWRADFGINTLCQSICMNEYLFDDINFTGWIWSWLWSFLDEFDCFCYCDYQLMKLILWLITDGNCGCWFWFC
jgi:hypothetical protein